MRELAYGWMFAFSFFAAGCSGNGDPAGESEAAGSGGTDAVSVGSAGDSGGASSGGGGLTDPASSSKGGAAGSIANQGGGNAGASGSVGHAGAAGSSGSNGRDGGSSTVDGSTSFDGSLSNYNPCPAKGAPCAIMPFGDSITEGDHGDNTADGGYRPPLFHLALAHAQSITFVGQASNGPDTVDGVAFPKNHDGFPGFSIDGGGPFPGITSFAADHIKMYKPQIVTLMIGTNDIASQIDLPNAPTRLGHLLDVILGADANLLLVVAQITPSKDDTFNARAVAYNAAIPGLVKTRSDAGKHIVMVDMWSAFMQNANYRTDYLNDIVHCKNAGYAKMADVWYAGIGSLFR